MPKSVVAAKVGEVRTSADYLPVFSDSPEGRLVITAIQEVFEVSQEAANVRLTRLRYITPGEPVPTIFDFASQG